MNLIEVAVARRVPGIYVILSLARPVKEVTLYRHLHI